MNLSSGVANFYLGLKETVRAIGVRVIADHQGGVKGASSIPVGSPVLAQPGLSSLLSLAASKHVVIKISGLYQSSDSVETVYSDLEPLIREFAQKVPDSLIWGSDWPHTGKGKDRIGKSVEVPELFQRIDDAKIIRRLQAWVGQSTWRMMLVETPDKMFQ